VISGALLRPADVVNLRAMTRHVHGPTVLERGVRFSLWAPALEHVRVRIDGREHPLERSGDGWWQAEVPGARVGDRYSFVLPDGRSLPDPASARQPDGVHGPSQVWDPGRHAWRHGFGGLPLEELVFYELHLGTFTGPGTLDAATDRLGDLAELGVTCVELMPVQPFPGERNWGYDGVSLRAVHEGYGGPDALQRFVDAAHGHGLAVCLDVVYNHLGPEGNYLPAFGPYFTNRHRSPWGDGIDYDGPASAPVRAFAIDAALRWVRDFRLDALRLDAVHAIADDGERHLVGALADAVATFARESGRRIHVVAESDLEDRKVVDPPPAGWGCAAMWSDDFHHAVHALVTGERDAFLVDFGGVEPLARALARGFSFAGEPSRYRGKPWGTGTEGLAPARFVFCAQNHDQVGNRPLGERLTALVPRAALEPVATLMALGSGLPLLFMGEEYGEERPFLYFTSHSDPQLAKAVSEGRTSEHIAGSGPGREIPDPQAPATFERSKLTHRRDGWHGALREHYRAMLALRRRHARRLGSDWPRVAVDGASVRLVRPGLEVAVNLSARAQGALPPWGWSVREG
jgi:maltooligosyltrehalose trehalohydrolase